MTNFQPVLITRGVSNVKQAVDKTPRQRVYFPPNLSASIPPGM